MYFSLICSFIKQLKKMIPEGYYATLLGNYLKTHRPDLLESMDEDELKSFKELRVANALQTFEDARKLGSTVVEAKELATEVLFGDLE